MKLPDNKSKLIAAGVLTVAIVGGGASIAAASPSAPATAGSSTSTGSQQDENDPTITGTVQAPAEQADGSETGSEAAEDAALKSLATVTPDQATQAALAAVPGTVGQVELGNENGFVVYDIEVTDSNGTVTEVTVDAGNASVLAQQAEGAGENADEGTGGGAETPDQPDSATDTQG